jgi:hypothetical protein
MTLIQRWKMETMFIRLFSATDIHVLMIPQALESLAQGFKKEESDQGGDDGYQKV